MRLWKSKPVLPMENLIEFIDIAVTASSELSTRCLIDELGKENAGFAATIVRLERAHAAVASTPGREAELTGAFLEFVTRTVKMAVFTAELMHRGVRWTGDGDQTAWPVVITFN